MVEPCFRADWHLENYGQDYIKGSYEDGHIPYIPKVAILAAFDDSGKVANLSQVATF